MPQGTATPQGQEVSYVARKIDQARALERERSALQEKIAANRRQLRDMAATGDLTAEESKFVSTFYPEKERGTRRSKEEVEATRKARAAARVKQQQPAQAA